MSTPTNPSEEASSQHPTEPERYVRGKTDPAWGHCKQIVDEHGKKSLLCLHCNKSYKGGGINRFKSHLAGEGGQVEKCKKVSADIRFQMKQHIEEGRKNKRKTPEGTQASSCPIDEDSAKDDTSAIPLAVPLYTTQQGNAAGRIGNYFMPRTTPGAQPTLKSVLQSKEVVEKCDLAISKWMIDACVPFNAVNSAYYQPMIDAISSMSPGYKGPNFYSVRGFLLNKWVEETKLRIESYREIWKQTGCTLMADGWTDRNRRTLINFLVYCPKGIVFLKSVDASEHSKTADMLYNLFRSVVLEIGPENVVHMVTDNAANYVAAGRLLETEFPKLYWSPCAAHCINLMLSDFGKFDDVKDVVSQATTITKYLYNHCAALCLMRKHTGHREILRPAPTRFATNFIALQSILGHKDALRSMVTSREWTSSSFSRDPKAKNCVELVLDSGFWKKCAIVVKLSEPLVRVLRIVDSEDKPAMGFLYQAIYKAREEMVRRFQRNKKVVEPYLKVLDNRWDSQLRKNLHAAGYWLNPACRFDADFSKYESTLSGILDFIEKYSYGDEELATKLTSEMRIYKDCELDFGRMAAKKERKTIRPDQWWETYGIGAPNLRRLAIRILSQTCSASGCERNWSLFEHIHSKKRNRLEHQKLNDLVFVRYNLRLEQRNQFNNQNDDPVNLETIHDHSNWVVEEDPSFLTIEELEAFRNELANPNICTQPSANVIDHLNLDEDEDAQVVTQVEVINNENAQVEDGEDPMYDDDTWMPEYEEYHPGPL